jgi:serine/threonine protein kinase
VYDNGSVGSVIDQVFSPFYAQTPISQYSSRVLNVSSFWGGGPTYLPQQLLGEQDVFTYGDNGLAWCPLTADGTGGFATGKEESYDGLSFAHDPERSFELYGYTEYVEIGIDEPVFVSEIVIGENRGQGAVKNILAKDPYGGWMTLYASLHVDTSVQTLFSEFSQYRYNVPEICITPFKTDHLRFELDTKTIPDWNEIDFIEVKGYRDPDPSMVRWAGGDVWRLLYVSDEYASGIDTFTYNVNNCPTKAQNWGENDGLVNINIVPIGIAGTLAISPYYPSIIDLSEWSVSTNMTLSITYYISSLPSSGELYDTSTGEKLSVSQTRSSKSLRSLSSTFTLSNSNVTYVPDASCVITQDNFSYYTSDDLHGDPVWVVIDLNCPTPRPTSYRLQKSNKEFNLLYILPIAIGVVIFTIGIFLFCRWAWEQRVMKKSLKKLPVHRAIRNHSPYESIIEYMALHMSTIHSLDYKEKSVFDLALEYNDHDLILHIVQMCLPYDPVSLSEIDPQIHGYIWTKLVQLQEGAIIVEAILKRNLAMAQQLCMAKDSSGRQAINIACTECQQILKQSLYLHGRYEIMSPSKPEHKSSSSIVHFAYDHGGDGEMVALKLMKHRDQFERELILRQNARLDPKYVMGILTSYDGVENDSFFEELERRGLQEYPYCVVMTAGDKNLQEIMNSEHVNSMDWNEIRNITIRLATALKHIHSHGIIHGDVKPSNILRVDSKYVFIDFDSSAVITEGFSGVKYSSAYLPPELIHIEDGIAIVKSVYDLDNNEREEEKGYDYDSFTAKMSYMLAPAAPSHDVWALGLILYELCTGKKFFIQDKADNIDSKDLMHLATFTDDFKTNRLVKIQNLLARNLISCILTKDPLIRPSVDFILNHSFVTGRNIIRMSEDEPDYDIFLSYRVASDYSRANKVYNLLTAKGFKVWYVREFPCFI